MLLICIFQPFTVTGSPKSNSTCQSLIEPGPLLVIIVSTWKYWRLLQVLTVPIVQLTLGPLPLELLLELEELLDDELDEEVLDSWI